MKLPVDGHNDRCRGTFVGCCSGLCGQESGCGSAVLRVTVGPADATATTGRVVVLVIVVVIVQVFVLRVRDVNRYFCLVVVDPFEE